MNYQAVLLELLEELLQVDLVLLLSVAGYQDVVKVDKDAVQPLQHLIHEVLERLPGITEPKGHPQKLVEPEGGDNCCLGDVLLGHRDLVVPLEKIQLTEDLFAGQPGQ